MNQRNCIFVKRYVSTFAIGLIIIATLSIASTIASANELIENGGFETGDTTGWNLFVFDGGVIDSESHTGRYSLEMRGVDIMSQTFSPPVRTTGDLIFWGKNATPFGGGAWVVVTYSDGTNDSLNWGVRNNEWIRFNVPLDHSKSVRSVWVGVPESEPVYIDDISLEYNPFIALVTLDPDVRFPWLKDLRRIKGNWINAYLDPPMPPAPSQEKQNSPDAYDFDIPSIKLIISPGKSIQIKELVLSVDKNAPSKIGDHDGNGVLDLMVGFDKAIVIDYLEMLNKNECRIRTDYEVKIIGNLKDGTPFEGKLANKELVK